MLETLLFICGLPCLGARASPSPLNCSVQTSEGSWCCFQRRWKWRELCLCLVFYQCRPREAWKSIGKVGSHRASCRKWSHCTLLSASDGQKMCLGKYSLGRERLTDVSRRNNVNRVCDTTIRTWCERGCTALPIAQWSSEAVTSAVGLVDKSVRSIRWHVQELEPMPQ